MVGEEFLEKLVSGDTMPGIGEFFGFDGMEIDPEKITVFAMGDKFMKRSYAGKFKAINDCILESKDKYMRMLHIDTFHQLRTEMRDYIVIQAMAAMFARYKQAYRFDHDFMDALVGTESVKIPLQVFTSLPFPTFYLDMDGYKDFQPYFGCLVTVTLNPDTGLPGISILRFVKQEGVKEELIFSVYLTPNDLLKYGMLVSEGEEIYINISRDRINCDSERGISFLSAAEGAKPFKDTNVQQFVLFVMQAILYLGSYKPDILETEPSNGGKKAGKNSRKPETQPETNTEGASGGEGFKKWDVGIRYGNEIRINKRKIKALGEDQDKKTSHTKRSPIRPHVRAAHWHTYLVGKGRTNRIVKWIPPVFVCGHTEFPITVHHVS